MKKKGGGGFGGEGASPEMEEELEEGEGRGEIVEDTGTKSGGKRRRIGDGGWRGSSEMEEEDGWRSVEGVDRRGWRCCVPAAAVAVAAA